MQLQILQFSTEAREVKQWNSRNGCQLYQSPFQYIWFTHKSFRIILPICIPACLMISEHFLLKRFFLIGAGNYQT